MSKQTNTIGPKALLNEPASTTAKELPPIAPKRVTKHSQRVQTWKKLKSSSNRYPVFLGSDKAAASLAGIDEFKNAKTFYINNDIVLNAAKFEAYNASKSVYLQREIKSLILYLRVDGPTDRTEITLEDAVKFDMVIIESVVVSRDGYRIGCGNGLVDQDIGLLIEIGSITPETVIATIVDDLQVVDTLPKKIFKKHDTPVDLIVTPTEVIRVAKRLPRPAGLYWELLSEHHLELTPYFQLFEKHSGKIILKDTDIDPTPKLQRQRSFRFVNSNRLKSNTEQQANENDIQQKSKPILMPDNEQRYDEIYCQQERKPLSQRRNVNCRPYAEPEGGDQSTPESKNKLIRNFCTKLSNLFRSKCMSDPNKKPRKNCANNDNDGDGGEGGVGGSDKKQYNEQANNAVGDGGNGRIEPVDTINI